MYGYIIPLHSFLAMFLQVFVIIFAFIFSHFLFLILHWILCIVAFFFCYVGFVIILIIPLFHLFSLHVLELVFSFFWFCYDVLLQLF
jgi:hypothetical protein